ncbi:MAG: flavodoxin family protein [Anaerolineae bacterium]
MKAIVIYDSLYGNTEKVARAIGAGLSDATGTAGSVQVVNVGNVNRDGLAMLDLLLVGGPTHGSNPSPPMRDFLDRIPPNALAGVQVAAFDTRTDMDEMTGLMRMFGKFLDRLGYAAPKIAASLEAKGGQVVKPAEGFIVLGTEGPLLEGELERAGEWGRQIAASHV